MNDELAPVGTGAQHMAWDAEALARAGAGEAAASFRVYRWSPGCVSLGRSQPEALVDAPVLRRAGLSLVRRPTGGRALLHALGDLTYSVILPASHPAAKGSLAASYLTITKAVSQALTDVGLAVCIGGEAGPGSRPDTPGACFEEHLVETVLLSGRKLVGSAQARSRGAVLQHGAIPAHVDYALQAALFAPRDPNAADRMAARFIGFAQGASDLESASISAALAHALGGRLRALVQEGEDGAR